MPLDKPCLIAGSCLPEIFILPVDICHVSEFEFGAGNACTEIALRCKPLQGASVPFAERAYTLLH